MYMAYRNPTLEEIEYELKHPEAQPRDIQDSQDSQESKKESNSLILNPSIQRSDILKLKTIVFPNTLLEIKQQKPILSIYDIGDSDEEDDKNSLASTEYESTIVDEMDQSTEIE